MSGRNTPPGGPSLTRYWPGPSFPTSPYVPSLMPHTQKTPLAENFDAWDGTEDTLGAAPGYLWGIDLYNHDCFWEAHEEWEQLWKAATAPSTARYYLQGLIQCAAASLKGVHGN